MSTPPPPPPALPDPDRPNQPPPLQQTSSDDNIWCVFSHLSPLVGLGIIVPLIVYLVKKDESPFVSHHAREALNFQISMMIYAFVCTITCIGIPLLPVIIIGSLIYSIIAAIKVSDPAPFLYEYPLTLRLIN
ncbi:MAG: DUF4870 domain-containing protein [Akkermansiaceae bacterium]